VTGDRSGAANIDIVSRVDPVEQASRWSDPTVIGWVGNAIMGATLLVAIIIAWVAQRASGRVSDFAAGLMLSERRLVIRAVLRDSHEADDVQQAFCEARNIWAAEPTEMRIAERLYYSNPAIALNEFADAYRFDPPAESLLQAVGQTLRQRFDEQELNRVLQALKRYAHMTSPDRAELGYWRSSPASLAADYVMHRLKGQSYDGRLGPNLRSFMDGPQPRLSWSVLSRLATKDWQPLECKFVLGQFALTNLAAELRQPGSAELTETVHDTALLFFTESAIFDTEQVKTLPEADALEGCTLAALDFVVCLAAVDPLAAADITKAALPAIEEALRYLHGHWQHTSASMLRRPGQFEQIWKWWHERLATLPEAPGQAVHEVTATLDRLYPPERRAEMERRRSALGTLWRDEPCAPQDPGTGEPPSSPEG